MDEKSLNTAVEDWYPKRRFGELPDDMLQHPAVQQAAVVGLPDERLAEVPMVFVERKTGAAIEADGVLVYCRGKVAGFKIPRHAIFVAAMPMTASGKIRKVELREQAQAELI